jgi:hypothetical protein
LYVLSEIGEMVSAGKDPDTFLTLGRMRGLAGKNRIGPFGDTGQSS